MSPALEEVIKIAETPEVAEAAAALAPFLPAPEGPALAAFLTLVAAWERAGRNVKELAGIFSRYSAEAQALANSWS